MDDDTSNILDERVPEELPNEVGKARIRIIYSRLEALAHELEDCSATELIDGNPVVQYRDTLSELGRLTNRDFSGFMPNLQNGDDNPTCLAKNLRISAGTLLGELRPEFMPEQEQYYRPPAPPAATTSMSTTVQTDVRQNVELEVEVINNIKIELGAKLDELTAKYPADSKEYKFLNRLKGGLGAAKNFAGIVGLILTSAQAVALDYDKLVVLLKSLKLI